MHRLIKAIYCIFFSLALYVEGSSQCEIVSPIPIADNTTTSIGLLIEGAQNNDLADPNQGVCRVLIKFKHNAVGDLNMFLISPSGQSVQLIGPGGIASDVTQLTTWDIKFLPSNFPASPDAGFPDTWSDLNVWGSFFLYTGSYYPYNGDLLNFNSGPVNGTWSLYIEDVSSLDAGIVQYFSIEFCDGTGIDCNPCEAIASESSIDSLAFCYGTLLSFDDFNLTNPNGIADTALYSEKMTVFDNNQNILTSYIDHGSEITLQPGDYTICHLSVVNSDTLSLPNPNSSQLPDMFQNTLNELGLCAEISNACTNVIVYPVSDTILLSDEICKGDTLFINGLELTKEGQHVITFHGQNCDTVSLLNLNVLDFKPIITQEFAFISCLNKEIKLFAKINEVGKIPTYTWSTLNGNILSSNMGDSILINAPGTYKVVADYLGCTDSTTIIVDTDSSLPTLTLTADTINCKFDTVAISLTSTRPILSTNWDGPSGYILDGQTIKVVTAGSYVVTVTSDNGCDVTGSILVSSDFSTPTLQYEIASLDCKTDSVSLLVLDSSDISTVFWNGNVENVSDLNTQIYQSGSYQLTLTGHNGCTLTQQIEVMDTSHVVNTVIIGDTITCEFPAITLSSNSDHQINQYFWSGPAIVDPLVESPSIHLGGVYTLEVTDIQGCTGNASITILVDKLLPPIFVPNDSLTCNRDSIVLSIDAPIAGYKYSWNGPQLTSNLPNPIATVAGLYSVVVTAKNGCSTTAFFSIKSASDLPNVTFFADTITCTIDTAHVIPSDTSHLDFVWKNPIPLSDSLSPFATFNSGGAKFVQVTDRLTGCKEKYEIIVVDKKQFPVISLAVAELDCDSDSVQIQANSDIPLDSITWTSGSSFNSTQQSPFVYTTGVYSYSAYSILGCLVADSITVISNKNVPPILIDKGVLDCRVDSTFLSAQSNNAHTYEWFYNNTSLGTGDTIFVKTDGQFQVKVTYDNGCEDSSFVTVLYDTLSPLIALDGQLFLNCSHPTSSLNVTANEGGVSFDWQGPGIVDNYGDSISVNLSGYYTVVATDASHCTSVDSIEVLDLSDSIHVDIEKIDIGCNVNGSIILLPDGIPKSISWDAPIFINDNETSIETSTAGSYVYTVISKEDCITTDTVTIVMDTLKPFVYNLIPDTLTCSKPIGLIEFETDDDIVSASWTGPITSTGQDPFLEVNQPGQYFVEITGANGCITNEAIVVEQDSSLLSLQLFTDTLTCKNNKIDIYFTADKPLLSAQWIAADSVYQRADIRIKTGGQYIAIGTGLNGCETRDTVFIFENKITPTLILQDTFLLPCNGDSLALFVESPDSLQYFRWVGPNNQLISTSSNPKVASAQQIVLFAASENGCNTLDTTIVAKDIRKPIFSAINDTIRCNPPFANLVALDVMDDKDFFWEDALGNKFAQDTLKATNPGMYSLIVEIANKCTDTLQLVVEIDTIKPLPKIELFDPFQCQNKKVHLVGSITAQHPSSIEFSWQSTDGNFIEDSNTLKPLVDQEGLYILHALDAINGCEDSATYQLLYEKRGLESYFLNFNSPICLGEANGSILLNDIVGGFAPYTINLNEEVYTNQLALNDLVQGDYHLSIKDSIGCLLDTIITLVPGFDFLITLPSDTIISLGDSLHVTFFANNQSQIYNELLWQVNDDFFCDLCQAISFSPTINSTVFLEAVDSNGCVSYDSMFIRVKSNINVPLPNIFNPNSTASNNRFLIPFHPAIEEIEFVNIYDRWGNLVFHDQNILDNDIQIGWDGTLNGSALEEGVYIVVARLRLKNNEIKVLRTDLTLIR